MTITVSSAIDTSVLRRELLHILRHRLVEVVLARYECLADGIVVESEHRGMASDLVDEWFQLHKLPLSFHHALRHLDDRGHTQINDCKVKIMVQVINTYIING